MKSHTDRASRGVRGASREKACEATFAAASGEFQMPESEMDFCYLFQDPMRPHQPGDQPWATTVVMGHVAAQNPMSAALSTKSAENAFPSAMRAALVNRMAYAKAVLKVKALADKIALRASAEGILLKVETAPRSSSQSVGPVGRAQDAVECQIRCLRLELGTKLVKSGVTGSLKFKENSETGSVARRIE